MRDTFSAMDLDCPPYPSRRKQLRAVVTFLKLLPRALPAFIVVLCCLLLVICALLAMIVLLVVGIVFIGIPAVVLAAVITVIGFVAPGVGRPLRCGGSQLLEWLVGGFETGAEWFESLADGAMDFADRVFDRAGLDL